NSVPVSSWARRSRAFPSACTLALSTRLWCSVSSTAIPVAVSASATTTVAAVVVRARTELHGELKRRTGSPTFGRQSVAGAADGEDGAAGERGVDFAAQGADVHLDNVGVAVVGEVPDMFEDIGFRHHLTGAHGQVFQHRELFGGERDFLVTTAAQPGGGVKDELARSEERRVGKE